MSARITRQQLEAVVTRINVITGNRTNPYTKGEDGKFRANVGCYHLDGAYGGWALYRMNCESGSVNDIFQMGHVSKLDLYRALHAFLAGIEAKNV